MNMRITFACTMLIFAAISLAGDKKTCITTPKAEILRNRTMQHLRAKAKRFKLQAMKELRRSRALQARAQTMERLEADHLKTMQRYSGMIDQLTGMGIFQIFAERKIPSAEVQEQVDDAFRESWDEHLKTMQPVLLKRHSGTAQIITEQHNTFTELKRTMIPVIVSILLDVK